MEQILLAYGIPKETVAAITILYRNTKVKVQSPDGDTEYFDIVAGVLQGDTLAPYLFIIRLDDVFRTSIDKIKENGFELTKKRSRSYPATTIDIAILANTPDQAETLLHSLERAAASIGLIVRSGERGSGISVLPARYDDDDSLIVKNVSILSYSVYSIHFSIRMLLVLFNP